MLRSNGRDHAFEIGELQTLCVAVEELVATDLGPNKVRAR